VKTFLTFKKQLFYNYLLGSFIAICGVGGVFIFFTLDLSNKEMGFMSLVLFSSLFIMLIIEYLKFRSDLKPISRIFHFDEQSLSNLQIAFKYIHRYPIITFKRIMGPHLLGLSIPASIMCYIFIKVELLTIPFQYILLAIIGAILVAGMHGIIELFLTIKAIQPL
jgi:hypothetical protein